MARTKELDMLNGALLPKLMMFSLPLALTGILQLLEKNGIIRRESVSNDARLKSLVPTQRAVELDARVCQCLRETDRQLTRGISSGQIQLFKETAVQMLSNLDAWEEES